MKRSISTILSLALALTMLAGCSSSGASSQTDSASGSAASNGSAVASVDENEAAAEQLLSDLTGSYEQLWDVILSDEYEQVWLDDCAEIVGEDNAEAAYEKLASMVTGDVYGEEAVEAYKDGGGAYFCGFTEGVDTIAFDGSTSTISGYDENGEELFSHTYHYIGMEEIRGLYEFESDDADSGEFTYFYLAPDTSDLHTTSSSATAATRRLSENMTRAHTPTGSRPVFRPSTMRI